MFRIGSSTNVELRNLIFNNGTHTGSSGGAIYFAGDSLKISSCIFNNCSANNGGAVASRSKYVNVAPVISAITLDNKISLQLHSSPPSPGNEELSVAHEFFSQSPFHLQNCWLILIQTANFLKSNEKIDVWFRLICWQEKWMRHI